MPTRATLTRALLVLVVGSACGGGTSEPAIVDTTITSVVVSGAAATIPPGAALQLTAKGKNAAGQDIPGTATWTSSANAVATVNGSGMVTGVANGSAEITATIGTVSGTRTITVKPAVVASTATVNVGDGIYYSFSPSQVDISVGGTVTFNWGSSGGVSHDVTFDPVTGAPSNVTVRSAGSVDRVFSTAGTFTYQCTQHAGMTGSIIVH